MRSSRSSTTTNSSKCTTLLAISTLSLNILWKTKVKVLKFHYYFDFICFSFPSNVRAFLPPRLGGLEPASPPEFAFHFLWKPQTSKLSFHKTYWLALTGDYSGFASGNSKTGRVPGEIFDRRTTNSTQGAPDLWEFCQKRGRQQFNWPETRSFQRRRKLHPQGEDGRLEESFRCGIKRADRPMDRSQFGRIRFEIHHWTGETRLI